MSFRKPFMKTNGYGVRRTRTETYNSVSSSSTAKAAWWDLRAKVWERDKGMCIFCPRYGKTPAKANEVHHIVELSHGGTNTMSNLGCICDACHKRRHPSNNHMQSRKRPLFNEPF